jgi:2-haloacid dehalogenase/putative hydrolase of the HAD superfamily
MDKHFDFITFDCYGTLIDWEEGIGTAFARAAAEDGVELKREDVVAAYHEVEEVVEGEPYRVYRDVLAESARRVAARLGWALAETRAGFLAASLASWRPFPDTNPALDRLVSAGYRLGLLSNVDDDLLALTRRHFNAEFDVIVTAQQVGSYKPAHRHFVTARQRIGDARWLHAAQSYVHDVVPSRALSIPCAWVNRKGEAPTGEARPDREVSTLAELADWLC